MQTCTQQPISCVIRHIAVENCESAAENQLTLLHIRVHLGKEKLINIGMASDWLCENVLPLGRLNDAASERP